MSILIHLAVTEAEKILFRMPDSLFPLFQNASFKSISDEGIINFVSYRSKYSKNDSPVLEFQRIRTE